MRWILLGISLLSGAVSLLFHCWLTLFHWSPGLFHCCLVLFHYYFIVCLCYIIIVWSYFITISFFSWFISLLSSYSGISLLFHYCLAVFYCLSGLFHCCLVTFYCLSKANFIYHRQLTVGIFYSKRKLWRIPLGP